MPAIAVSILVWMSVGSRLAASWKGETPIPSLAASKRVRPPVAVPDEIPTIEAETDEEKRFSALVRMHGWAAG